MIASHDQAQLRYTFNASRMHGPLLSGVADLSTKASLPKLIYYRYTVSAHILYNLLQLRFTKLPVLPPKAY